MQKSTRRRWIVWGVVAAAVVALLALALRPQPVPAELVEVTRGPLAETLDHVGKTRVEDRFVISAPVDGRVRRIELEPGDPVVANDTLLAVFEPAEPALLDERTQAEAEARVRAARAALSRTTAEEDRALAASELAEREVERARRLAASEITSRQLLDVAEAEARATRDALAAARSAVEAARYELQAAQARVLRPASAADGGATAATAAPAILLRSPIDGVVLQRLRQSAATVPMGEALLVVGDPSELEVVADFLSTDAVRMEPGMTAWIERWGGGEPLEGRVRRVEPAGFLKVSALGVEEQRVWVVVDFADPARAAALGDEFGVEVRVEVWRSDDALRVPTSSLFRHEGEWAVYRLEHGRARLRSVEVGPGDGLLAQVLDGLAEGDRVVAYPSDAVADGVRLDGRPG